MQMIGTRLDDKVVKILQKIAEEEHRPLSNLLRLIILDWLDYRKGIKIEVGIDGKVKKPKK
jgi:predicted transcriptional regulator